MKGFSACTGGIVGDRLGVICWFVEDKLQLKRKCLVRLRGSTKRKLAWQVMCFGLHCGCGSFKIALLSPEQPDFTP